MSQSITWFIYTCVVMVITKETQAEQGGSTIVRETPMSRSFQGDFLSFDLNLRNNSEDDMSDEKRLINVILARYERLGRLGRPVRNSSTPITVLFGLGLIQMELDEKDKVLSMSMWTRYVWKDEYLIWDSVDYSGIQTIRLRSDLVWIPDIMLYNTADVKTEVRDTLLVVKSDGTVTWFPHSIFHSSCSIDVTNFPFDEQQCHMWFGSWTHNSKEIDLTMASEQGMDLSTFQSDHKESSNWEVLNVTSGRRLMPSENDTPNFAVLTFQLNLRRKAAFSTYILTMPCIFLAFLTLVVFWLPPERPDRTGLAMSIFASFMVLLLILVEAAMPTASSIPLLGVYYCFNMIIIMLAIIQSCVAVNLARGNPLKHPPQWLVTTTVIYMVKIFFIREVHIGDIFRNKLRNDHRPNYSTDNNCDVTMELMPTETIEDHCHVIKNISQQVSPNNASFIYHQVEKKIDDVRKTLMRMERKLFEKQRREDEKRQKMVEWRIVSTILDRFFFRVYIMLIVLSLSVMFPHP